MAVGYLTSSSLIATVKRESMIPASQNTFTDADFLAIANQEIRIGMVPTILQYHEEYFVRDSDPIAIEANKSSYAIPYRAIGGKFRELFYKPDTNNLRSMSRISPDDRPYFQESGFQNPFVYFYIKGNEIVLLPDVGANPTGSLLFSYYFRPNELVDESRSATITGIAIGASDTVLTVNEIPSSLEAFIRDGITLTGFDTTSRLDILQNRPGHKTINFDVLPSAVDTTNKTITFSNDDIDTSSIILGDYICFAGECIIPQIPSDLHEVLVQRVIQRCVQALGDAQAVQMSSAKLSEMNQNMGSLIDNRAEGQATKAINRNGLVRNSLARHRYRGA